MKNRILCGLEFRYVAVMEPIRTAAGAIRQFRPQSRYQNKNRHRLHRYGRGPFCKFSIPRWHSGAGVYLLTVGPRVMYVGECANLFNRFNYNYGHIAPRACFDGGQLTNCKINCHILNLTKNGQRVRLWFHRTRNHKVVERWLLEKKQPLWNGRSD